MPLTDEQRATLATPGQGISGVRRVSDEKLVLPADRARLASDGHLIITVGGLEVLRLPDEQVVDLRAVDLGGGLAGYEVLVTDDLAAAPPNQVAQSRANEPPAQGEA